MKGQPAKGGNIRRISFNAPEELVRKVKTVTGRELTTVKAICLQMLKQDIADYERQKGKVLEYT